MLIFFISAQKTGHSEKPQCLKNFGILRILIQLNNYRRLINVEESFDLCPKFLGILKISSCFKRNWAA